MPNQNKKTRKSAQDVQDEIFRKMSVDRKIELSAKLWQLGKVLNNNRVYETNRVRPTRPSGKGR